MWFYILIAFVALIAGWCLGCYFTREFIYSNESYDWEQEDDKELYYAQKDMEPVQAYLKEHFPWLTKYDIETLERFMKWKRMVK